MQVLNLGASKKIPVLMEMVGAVSRATDPIEVQRAYRAGFSVLFETDGFLTISCRGLGAGEYKVTRRLLDDDNDYDQEDTWTAARTMPIHRGGFLGEVIRSAFPQVIHYLDIEDDPVLGPSLRNQRSMMAIPMFDNGEPLNWVVWFRKSPTGFSMENVEEAVLRSNLIGGQVKNVLTAKQLREANERIRREMERIASIQRSLLPEAMPDIPGVTLAASYATFDEAGGDMYTFRRFSEIGGKEARTPDDRFGIMIADVSGHGPSAAVVMAMLHAILYAFPHVPDGTAQLTSHLNEQLCAKRIEQSFTTAFIAIYDPATRQLTYTRAGHNPPLVKAAGEGVPTRRLDESGSLPLGVMSEASFDESTMTLSPGETLVLYTDGITEAMNPQRTMFGTEGIERALLTCSGEPACVVNSIITALREHEAGVRPADDQTILAMKVV